MQRLHVIWSLRCIHFGYKNGFSFSHDRVWFRSSIGTGCGTNSRTACGFEDVVFYRCHFQFRDNVLLLKQSLPSADWSCTALAKKVALTLPRLRCADSWKSRNCPDARRVAVVGCALTKSYLMQSWFSRCYKEMLASMRVLPLFRAMFFLTLS